MTLVLSLLGVAGVVQGASVVVGLDLLERSFPTTFLHALSVSTPGALAVLLLAAGVLARNERTFGAAAVLLPALLAAVPSGLLVSWQALSGLSISGVLLAGLVGSCLGLSERNRSWLPDYRQGTLGRWQWLAVLPLAAMAAFSLSDGLKAGMLGALLGALLLGALWRPGVLGGRPWQGLIAAPLLVAMPASAMLAVTSEPTRLYGSGVVTIQPANTTLWLPHGKTPASSGFNWQRNWPIITPPGGLGLSLLMPGSPEHGFTARFNTGTSGVTRTGLMAAIIGSARFGTPYDVTTSCGASSARFDCARAHYLAGDLDEAHRVASQQQEVWVERLQSRMLMLDIWERRPDLQPASHVSEVLAWMQELADEGMTSSNGFGDFARHLIPEHCMELRVFEAQNPIRPPNQEVVQAGCL